MTRVSTGERPVRLRRRGEAHHQGDPSGAVGSPQHLVGVDQTRLEGALRGFGAGLHLVGPRTAHDVSHLLVRVRAIFQRKLGGDPYIIFLLAGMLPWMWFTAGLTEGAKALRSQRKLIASTALPRQIWVLRAVCGKGLEFVFSIPVFIAFLIFYTPEFNASVPLVLVGMLIQFVLLLGLGLLLSPVMMLYRDI